MGGIELNEKWIKINFEIKPQIKSTGKIIGVDQGINKVITLSDGQITPKCCPHGHTLSSIINKLSRKRKGSRAFGRAQAHRTNFINWSINQLNLDDINEIRVERVKGLFFRSNRGRFVSHWAYRLINNKMSSFAEEHGVRVRWQSSRYRSQRCSSCGLVKKSNRVGEIYSCSNCGIRIDADFNAARNHEVNLPVLTSSLRLDNVTGFFWLGSGLFDLNGRSLQSLLPIK